MRGKDFGVEGKGLLMCLWCFLVIFMVVILGRKNMKRETDSRKLWEEIQIDGRDWSSLNLDGIYRFQKSRFWVNLDNLCHLEGAESLFRQVLMERVLSLFLMCLASCLDLELEQLIID